MRREKLLSLSRDAGLVIKEDKHESGHVFSSTILRANGGFVSVHDDGRVFRDWPIELPKRIIVKGAAQYLQVKETKSIEK
jgi:hypothetical protein